MYHCPYQLVPLPAAPCDSASSRCALPFLKGVSCDGGLACAKYIFQISDDGLCISHRGPVLEEFGYTNQEQYLVGIRDDPLIQDAVQYVKKRYFPGDPPGTTLADGMATIL